MISYILILVLICTFYQLMEDKNIILIMLANYVLYI